MKHIYPLLLAGSILLTAGCNDFFEIDISKDEVFLLAPSDNYETSLETINFWWEDVDGAIEYEIQIVICDFENIQSLVSDTIISESSIRVQLAEGKYQWRVRAINGSSSTKYSTRSITIINNQTSKD